MRWAFFLLAGGCAASTHSPQAPTREPITLTYLTVAGWQIESGDTTLLVDPYVSRPASLDGIIEPDLAAVAKYAPAKAQLVMVAHSHADHLLDAPAFAMKTGADLMGSRSTVHVGKASGLPVERLLPVYGGEDYQFAGFSVRVIPGLHSALENKHTLEWLGHEIPADVKVPLGFTQYAEGGTFNYLVRVGGHEVFVQSSANFIEREIEGLRPDIAILAPGLREEIHDYTCRLLRTLGHPPTVLVTHFDKWREPIGTPADSQQDFVDEVKRCAPGTTVIVPTPFQKITR